MYARVITFRPRVDVDREQALEIYHDLLAVLEAQEGFAGASLLLDEDAHRAVSITWWRDEECACTAGQTSLSTLVERVQSLLLAPPEIRGYHVVEQMLHQTAERELATP